MARELKAIVSDKYNLMKDFGIKMSRKEVEKIVLDAIDSNPERDMQTVVDAAFRLYVREAISNNSWKQC